MHGKGKYWKAGSKKEDPGIDGEWENGIRKGSKITPVEDGPPKKTPSQFWV